MDKTRVHYFRCPYCGKEGGHQQKVSKSTGLFRIKQLYESILILECQKCKKVCRLQFVGLPLKWADMSNAERKAFQEPHHEAFLSKSKGGKNGKPS